MIEQFDWTEVHGFESPEHFAHFTHWMREEVAGGVAIEVPVLKQQMSPQWRETWFKHLESHSTWRLVEPDPPFTGVFEKLEELPQ